MEDTYWVDYRDYPLCFSLHTTRAVFLKVISAGKAEDRSQESEGGRQELEGKGAEI
jgi:hypothetical protein